jgi:hypothetical protein
MSRNTKWLLAVAGLIGIAVAASACDLTLPVVDCSGINQPDMGGLVCLGLNATAITLSVLALIAALLVGLSGAVPV